MLHPAGGRRLRVRVDLRAGQSGGGSQDRGLLSPLSPPLCRRRTHQLAAVRGGVRCTVWGQAHPCLRWWDVARYGRRLELAALRLEDVHPDARLRAALRRKARRHNLEAVGKYSGGPRRSRCSQLSTSPDFVPRGSQICRFHCSESDG